MAAALAENFEQNIREAIDDSRQRVKAGGGVHHAECLAPIHAIEVNASGVKARDHRQRDLAGGLIRLVRAHISADFAERTGERAIVADRQVPCDAYPVCRDAHRLEALALEAHRRRQFEAEFDQALFDGDGELSMQSPIEYTTAPRARILRNTQAWDSLLRL